MSIDAFLDNPPRFSFKMLEVVAATTGLDPEQADRLGRIRLRVITGDPYEEHRDGEALVAATRAVGEFDLVLYLSLGVIEVTKGDRSWTSVLADAFAGGLELWGVRPDLIESGGIPAVETTQIPSVAETFDDVSFSTDGWQSWGLSTVVDLAEADVGASGHRTVILEPIDYGEPDCVSCQGTRIDVIMDNVRSELCSEHLAEFDELQSDALVVKSDAGRTATKLMFATTQMTAATGFYYRCRLVDGGEMEPRSLLEWIAQTFAGHGDVLRRATEDLEFADIVYRSMHEVCEEDPVAGVGVCRQIAAIVDEDDGRWLYEMTYVDTLIELGRTDEAEAIVRGWLASADRGDWYVYGAVGERLETWGEHEKAIAAFRRLVGTGVAANDGSSVGYALARLAHNAEIVDQPETTVWAERMKELVDRHGVGAIRPGRNDVCLCGSEHKFKRCCGAANRSSHPTLL